MGTITDYEELCAVASKLSRICGQLAYEKTHSRQDFIKRYGRSYI